MSHLHKDSASAHKLPSGPSARRRRSADKNEWVEIDKAEQRRPLIVIAFVAVILIVGIALIVFGS